MFVGLDLGGETGLGGGPDHFLAERDVRLAVGGLPGGRATPQPVVEDFLRDAGSFGGNFGEAAGADEVTDGLLDIRGQLVTADTGLLHEAPEVQRLLAERLSTFVRRKALSRT